MKKWLFRLVLIAILGVCSWYFFLKEHHYRISFTTRQPTGIVYNHILNWNEFIEGEQEIELVSHSPFSKVEQQLVSGDSLFTYKWFIRPEGDTKTKVTAYITDNRNGYTQKFQVPFTQNAFIRRSISNVKLVGDALIRKADAFRVHSIKDTVISPRFCAYITVESKVEQKASAMLQNIGVVMDYINDNALQLKGDPFLEVTEWDMENESIKFDFCFPISAKDSLPSSSEVKFKTTEQKKVLKAEFNGNYRVSSNAWYYLLDHAERNHREVQKLPIEYFLNDPHEGGNPLEWKALIFLPLKE